MLFGLCNAPTTFQQVMNVAFQDQLRKDTEIFLDDFCVYGKEEDHPQASVRGVRSFYGLANYYRRAIPSYAEIASLLSKLLKKLDTGTSPIWNKACEEAFLILNKKLVSAPVLVPPNWAEPFHVYVDASLIALGCVLSQKDTRNIDHPIYFASRQLIATEKNYTTSEREALGMIFALQKFRHYLLGYPFTFYVDHDAFKYLIINQI